MAATGTGARMLATQSKTGKKTGKLWWDLLVLAGDQAEELCGRSVARRGDPFTSHHPDTEVWICAGRRAAVYFLCKVLLR